MLRPERGSAGPLDAGAKDSAERTPRRQMRMVGLGCFVGTDDTTQEMAMIARGWDTPGAGVDQWV
jgi:hypothetical protein